MAHEAHGRPRHLGHDGSSIYWRPLIRVRVSFNCGIEAWSERKVWSELSKEPLLAQSASSLPAYAGRTDSSLPPLSFLGR